MAKLTPFGIALRKLRIDKEMRLLDLAERLDKSTAMISAIETGRKAIPDGFVTSLSRAMSLSSVEIGILRKAKSETLEEVRVAHLQGEDRGLVAALARSFDTLSPEFLEELRKNLLKSLEEEIPFRRKRRGMLVPPMSNVKIETLAGKIRAVFCGQVDAKIPIIEILEFYLVKIIPSFIFEVRSKADMGAAEGLVLPRANTLILREDVYRGACHGEARARFTACHELGHYVMHNEAGLARSRADNDPIYCDAEWQADRFAGFLMIPRMFARTCNNLESAAEKYGTSMQAASVMLSHYGQI